MCLATFNLYLYGKITIFGSTFISNYHVRVLSSPQQYLLLHHHLVFWSVLVWRVTVLTRVVASPNTLGVLRKAK